MRDVQVPLRLRVPGPGLRRRGVARHQPQALGPGGKAVTPEHSVHPVRGEDDPSPLRTAELRGDPGRAEPGVTQGEGHHPLLDEGRGGVGHPGAAPFSRSEDLRAVQQELPTPPVVGGGMDPHGPARCPSVPQFLGEGECSQPEPVQGIIGGQGGPPFRSTWVVKREDGPPLATGVGCPPVSLQLGDRTD